MIDHRFTALEAADLAAETGWSIFPVSPEKRPVRAGSWRAYSTNDPDAILDLWAGRRMHLAVDLGKSGLVVVDQDRDVPPEELAQLEEAGTLTLRSINRQMPHWYFKNPGTIGNSVWAGGDIKGTGGYVVVSRHEPILEAPIQHYMEDKVLQDSATILGVTQRDDRDKQPYRRYSKGLFTRTAALDEEINLELVASWLGVPLADVEAVNAAY